MSFPSGHTSAAFSCATLANRNLKSIDALEDVRPVLEVANTVLAAGVGWARVEAGKHYPSDVLFGAALGHFLTAFIHDAFMNLPKTVTSISTSSPSRTGPASSWPSASDPASAATRSVTTRHQPSPQNLLIARSSTGAGGHVIPTQNLEPHTRSAMSFPCRRESTCAAAFLDPAFAGVTTERPTTAVLLEALRQEGGLMLLPSYVLTFFASLRPCSAR